MKEYGLIPDLKSAKRDKESIRNFIELHIEQGPILDSTDTPVGLIEYIPGIEDTKSIFMESWLIPLHQWPIGRMPCLQHHSLFQL